MSRLRLIISILLTVCTPAWTAEYHVRATGGSDSNDGSTYPMAFATIAKVATVAASGDTIYFSGIFRLSDGVQFFNLSHVTFTQEPGQAAPDIRHETLAGMGWTSLGSNRWSKTLPAGLGPGGGSAASQAVNGEFLFQWNTTTATGGRPSGHLQFETGSGPVNTYDYNNTTGLTTINALGSPNGATTDVSYSVGGVQCIQFINAGNILVQGLTFSLNCGTTTGYPPYGIIISNAHECRIVGCTFYDGAWHHAGFLNQASGGVAAVNNSFESCVFYGGAAGLGHSVHYTADSTVPMSGARWTGCTFHGHRYLDPAGTTMGGQPATVQIPCLSHTDGDPCINDILADQCTYIEYEPGWLPFSCNSGTNVGATWDWASCPARMDRCIFRGDGTVQTGATFLRNPHTCAFRRCAFDYRNMGPSGLAGVSGAGGLTLNSWTAQFWLFDACAFVINGRDDANDTRMIGAYGDPGNELRFVNCSFHEVSTGHGTKIRMLFSPGFNSLEYIRLRGCAISFGESYSGNHLFGEDFVGPMDAAHHDVLDCAYHNVSTFSENAALDTQAEWQGVVDTVAQEANFPSVPMFPNSPADLSLAPASSLWTLRRSTSAVVPTGGGINGPYAGFYGPYQYDPQSVCYPNCDESTAPPILNIQDFACFLNRFAAQDSYANCDGSTTPPVLNILDFSCFLNRFAAGCP